MIHAIGFFDNGSTLLIGLGVNQDIEALVSGINLITIICGVTCGEADVRHVAHVPSRGLSRRVFRVGFAGRAGCILCSALAIEELVDETFVAASRTADHGLPHLRGDHRALSTIGVSRVKDDLQATSGGAVEQCNANRERRYLDGVAIVIRAPVGATVLFKGDVFSCALAHGFVRVLMGGDNSARHKHSLYPVSTLV